jgi:hypothetical protein
MRAIGPNTELAGFAELSEHFDSAAGKVLELAQNEELQFSDPIREYATAARASLILFSPPHDEATTSASAHLLTTTGDGLHLIRYRPVLISLATLGFTHLGQH